MNKKDKQRKKLRLSKKQVRHIAQLANLSLSKQEVNKFQKELSEILEYIGVLNQINTQGIQPTSQTTNLKNVFRKDKVKKSLSQKQALGQAAGQNKGYFKVKSIFNKK